MPEHYNLPIPILSAIIGAVILLLGRKLFWLCVAAIGFAAGVELAPMIMQQPSPLLALTFAVVLGFVGALLALFLQKVAIAVAGFLSGGKLAVALVAAFYAQNAPYWGITFVVGGLIGMILLLMLFDWALIFLSSIVGAHLIGQAVTLPPTGATILFVVLVVAGVLVQAGTLRTRRAEAA